MPVTAPSEPASADGEQTPRASTGDQASDPAAATQGADRHATEGGQSEGDPLGNGDGESKTATRPTTVGTEATGPAEVVAASFLQVNDEFFTVDDILNAAAPELLHAGARLDRAAFREAAARILNRTMRNEVGRTLVIEEAERRLTEQQTQLIDAEVEEWVKGLVAESGGSRTKLERMLEEQGTTLGRTIEAQRRSLLVRAYLDHKFEAQVSVDRRTLLEEYRRRIEDFTTPRKVRMQMIAAPFRAFLPDDATNPTEEQKAEAREKARETIQAAMAALSGGQDFGQVARRLSRGVKAEEGGLWPLMPAGSLREEKIEEGAFALEEGQVSNVIETDTGFYLVKARRVQPRKITPFTDAQGEIERQLKEQRREKLSEEYFETLYKEASINRSEEFLDFAIDRAVERYWRPRAP